MRCYSLVFSSLPFPLTPLLLPLLLSPPLTPLPPPLPPWGANDVGYIDNISTKHIVESKNALDKEGRARGDEEGGGGVGEDESG